jgi:hypothetical protein
MARMPWRNVLANQLPFRNAMETSMKRRILVPALAALGLSLSCASSSAGWDDSYVRACCTLSWQLPWASGPAADYRHRWYRLHRRHKSARYYRLNRDRDR